MAYFNNMLKKWIRDPNGWIAICTIILVFSSFCALRISQDTEKRQLRAYVSPANMQSSAEGTTINVRFDIENFGQTPAKNCKIRGDIAILPFPLPERYRFQIPAAPYKQNAIIPPRATKPPTVGVHRTFTKAEIDEITSKDAHRRIFTYGILDYKDIFDNDHFTKFCFFITMNPQPGKDAKGRPVNTFSWVDCDQHTDFD